MPPRFSVLALFSWKLPALLQTTLFGIVIVPPFSAMIVPLAPLVQLIALSLSVSTAPSARIVPLLVH